LNCETQWVRLCSIQKKLYIPHLGCVSLDIVPRNWVCEACKTRSDHDDDVTLPYMAMCLIT
ncbi:hypothetical protein K443DRAFT_36791, partial [Laccaria amethystina LaAM-08-1]